MTLHGTSNFVSFAAAVRYYKPYGEDRKSVQQKVDDGDINIGEPRYDPTREHLKIIDDGTRYAIGQIDTAQDA